MAEQKILCNVKSCYYNEGGDLCLASEIMVINNLMASPDMEVGALGGQANQTGQTACETFIPKEKGPKAGVKRLAQ